MFLANTLNICENTSKALLLPIFDLENFHLNK
jgi:hypothetical protein